MPIISLLLSSKLLSLRKIYPENGNPIPDIVEIRSPNSEIRKKSKIQIFKFSEQKRTNLMPLFLWWF